MENKVMVNSLAAALAQHSGKSKKICEDFLKEFFKLTSETLEKDESLRIKGFGTFKVVEMEARASVNVATGEPHEIPAYKKVVFTPSKELAAIINKPFEEFESVEVDDEIPDDYLFYSDTEDDADETEASLSISENGDKKDEEVNISDENEVETPILRAGSTEEDLDDIITYEAYHEPEETAQSEQPAEAISSPQPVETTEAPQSVYNQPEATEETAQATEPSDPVQAQHHSHHHHNRHSQPVYDYDSLYEEEYQEQPKSRFWPGFAFGSLSMFAVCVVIFMLGCFFEWWPVNFGKISSLTQPAATEVAQVEQNNENTATEAPTVTEVPEPVYDTVSTTRFLTTIAREHYGDFNFWPYIYLENESILGHPDRITPGTRVVVPDLSKYGVDPKNKDDVAEAKKKGAEIYARYK